MMSDVDPRTSELRKIHDNVQNEIRGAMIGLPSEACQPGDFFSTPGRPLQRPDGFVTGNPVRIPVTFVHYTTRMCNAVVGRALRMLVL